MSTLLPHKENVLQVYNGFSIYQKQIINEFWDKSKLKLSTQSRVLVLSHSPSKMPMEAPSIWMNIR